MSDAGFSLIRTPKSRELVTGSEDHIREFSWSTIVNFSKQRSFRRVFFAAGSVSLFFTAWYLYKRLTTKTEKESAVPPTNKENSNALKLPTNGSATNCNDDPVNEKIISTRSPSKVENKVIVHCCPRGYFVPSIATEPLKLETFLRVANIPYEVNFCNEYETPFLTYGDKTGNEFRECVRILSEKYNVNLECKDATPSRKTASNLVEISLDNQFSWAILIWRWIFDEGRSLNKIHAINALGEEVAPVVSLRVKDATRYHPIGQLEKTEFVKSINQGIHDISAALGKHKYFQGQQPTIVDCHAFAILSQIMWNMPGSPFEGTLRKFGNLVDFIRRMKEKYWPDWNELILKPQEFDEKFSATLKQLQRSTNKTRKPSKSSEHAESFAIKTSVQTHGAKGDANGGDTYVGLDGKLVLSNSSSTKKILLDPNTQTDLPKKEIISNDSSYGTSKGGIISVTPAQNHPVGILKTATAKNSVDVSNPKSGFISVSIGSTKFPVEQINEDSNLALADTSDPPPPFQQFHHHHHMDALGQECTTNVASLQQHIGEVQVFGNANTGNNYSTPVSHNPIKVEYQHLGSINESMNKSSERHQAYPCSMIAQQQRHYSNYSQSKLPSGSQMNSYQRQNTYVEDYKREHNVIGSNSPQYYHSSPASAPHAGVQPLYDSPQIFSSQTIPGGVSPYAQSQNYASETMDPADNTGMTPLPAFSQPHQPLNPEQMQKAAQVRYQYQQQQQSSYSPSSYNSYNYNTATTAAGVAPLSHVVAPPFDARNQNAALMRF